MTHPATVLTTPDHQAQASEPRRSVWVSASAGAGKTTVLVNRLLRLLLDGNRPEKLLCITYTKSAASEITERVTKAAIDWAISDELQLSHKLEKLLGRKPSRNDLQHAKSLLPKILQAPGGMKIMTIHAFCQSVLSRFPLEAGINGNFKICDDLQSIALLNQAKQNLLTETHPDDDLAASLEFLYDKINEETQDSLLSALIKKRHKISAILARYDHDIAAYRDDFYRLCGLAPQDDKATVENAFQDAIPSHTDLEGFRDVLYTGKGASPQNVAKNIQAFLNEPTIDRYCSIFLTASNTIQARLFTGTPTDHQPLQDFLGRESERAFQFKHKIMAVDLAQSGTSLFHACAALLERYQELKRRRNLLDYEDQILLTERLLTELSDCQWVLYKLDAGIDHIMLDEAQDTSPTQWRIIQILASEFFSGHGAKDDKTRTVFVVGDEKQSIFSFQNADPVAFSSMRETLRHEASDAVHPFDVVPLNKNYRSSSIILDFVDRIFADQAMHRAITHDTEPVQHNAHFDRLPGTIDLWPLLPYDKANKLKSIYVLADRIASEVETLLTKHHDDGKPIKPGDVMILVRKRAPMVGPLVKAFKDRNIPVRSIDRQLIAEALAVQDCLAALSFAVNPFDDYNLACLLKSPLIGMAEEDLYTLSYARTQSLWETLQERAEHAAIIRYCRDMMASGDTNNPYEFIHAILTQPCCTSRISGRYALIQRLGYDTDDILDQFLDVIYTYQSDQVATNQGFLTWFAQSGATTKGQDGTAQPTHVRIMTVHASKGLQAPIVFLADAHSKPESYNSKRDVMWDQDDRHVFWAMDPGKDHPIFVALKEAFLHAAFDEYYRLLYVALTRARFHLYICGCEQARALHKDYPSWYDAASAQLEHLSYLKERNPYDGLRVVKPGNTQSESTAIVENEIRNAHVLPDYLREKPMPEKWPYFPLRPSQLPGKQQAVFSPLAHSNVQNIRRGDILHKIFAAITRHPVEERAAILTLLIKKHVPEERLHASYYEEIWNVLTDPRFQDVFSSKARAEVPITGQIELNGVLYNVSGQIDRLLVTDERVLIVDFKTNRPASRRQEDVSENYIFQMQAYKTILQNIYPDKQIDTAILWTSVPYLLPLSL